VTITLTLRDQVMARPAEPSLVLPWREGAPMRLADLIRERVMLEWDRREDGEGFAGRPLVEAGASPGGGRRGAGLLTRDEAVALALDGFRRNAFFVVVDDRQVTELDAEIRIAPETAITFVRLLPLVGG
jgi:hypothetical protein